MGSQHPQMLSSRPLFKPMSEAQKLPYWVLEHRHVSREDSCPQASSPPGRGSLSLLLLPVEKSSDLEKPALPGQEFDTFHWNNVFKIGENHSETTRPRNPGRVPPSLWLWEALTFLCRSAPSSFLLLGHWVFKNPENPRGARRKAAASRTNSKGGCVRSHNEPSRENKGRSLHNRPPTPRPWRCNRAPPAPVSSFCPASGQPPPQGRRGLQDALWRLSGHSLSGLFCLLNSSAVSEPGADPDLSSKTPQPSSPEVTLAETGVAARNARPPPPRPRVPANTQQ
jgi:hypothetical protein